MTFLLDGKIVVELELGVIPKRVLEHWLLFVAYLGMIGPDGSVAAELIDDDIFLRMRFCYRDGLTNH